MVGNNVQWTKRLAMLKDYKFDVLKTFFESRGVCMSEYSRGYKFFTEGYVQNIEVEVISENCSQFSVRANCHHSQKRNEKAHTLYFTFSVQGMSLLECFCSCAIGLSESCHHLIGLAYQLQDFTFRELTIAPSETTSCTSRPMSWHKPRGSKIEPENIMSVSFAKSSKVVRKRKPVHYRHFVPKTSIEGNEKAETGSEKTKRICKALGKIDPNIPFSYLVNVENKDESKKVIEMQKKHAEFPIHTDGSVAISNNCTRPSLPFLNSTTVNILIELPVPHKDGFCDFSFEKSMEIEFHTRDQSQSQEWFQNRKGRFTASNFKKICCRKKSFDLDFFNAMWDKKNLDHVTTIQHGRREEANARALYQVQTGNQVFISGLLIHPYAPHLGASPDGVVYDKESGYGLLEIKCPCGTKTGTFTDALLLKTFILRKQGNNKLEIRSNHDYYYQMQGQMLLAGLLWCDLALYFKKSGELIVKRVHLDEEFCREMYSKLTDIYNKYVK